MPPIPLMRAGTFKPAVDFLTSLGAATENALESVKLFPALLEEPDALIPLHQANWLPCPPSDPFNLTIRVYQPEKSLLNGSYEIPPVTRVRSD